MTHESSYVENLHGFRGSEFAVFNERKMYILNMFKDDKEKWIFGTSQRQ